MGELSALNPTLWRTCRVLANETRLQLLIAVIKQRKATVAELAEMTRLKLPVASSYLRMLQARGMLEAERCGRFVYYRARANSQISFASKLLVALEEVLIRRRTKLKTVIRALTSFTHPRRITIVQVLAKSPQRFLQLSASTGISRQALQRHLVKLVNRGLVQVSDGGLWEGLPPRSAIAKALLEIVVPGIVQSLRSRESSP